MWLYQGDTAANAEKTNVLTDEEKWTKEKEEVSNGRKEAISYIYGQLTNIEVMYKTLNLKAIS